LINAWHRDKEILDPLVQNPALKGLENMHTGVGDADRIKIVITPHQTLGKDITTKRAEHPQDMGLGYILWLMASHDPDGQHIGGIEDFLRDVSTHVAKDLTTWVPLLPVFNVSMAILINSPEIFYHFLLPVLNNLELSLDRALGMCCTES
jgi:hypothetical protein